LAAIVVNHGQYTITELDAQLRLATAGGPSLVAFATSERVPSTEDLHPELVGGMSARFDALLDPRQLTPWDRGTRFESDPVLTAQLPGSHPVVRWRDRWGTRWEHRLGKVRQITDAEPWVP
jgi:hypothetical protein